MQIWRHKLENNTLNSVLDSSSNKIITKKICPKGPKLWSAKLWLLYIFVRDWLSNIMNYDTLSKVINSYLTTIWLNYTWLKLSLEIRRFCFTESNGSNFVLHAPNRSIWTLQSHRTSTLVGSLLKMRQIWDMARLLKQSLI
jgi:hypothetical protein